MIQVYVDNNSNKSNDNNSHSLTLAQTEFSDNIQHIGDS